MIDPRKGGESQHENEKWKVFVLLEQKKHGLVLRKDSEVLYQVRCIHLMVTCKTQKSNALP